MKNTTMSSLDNHIVRPFTYVLECAPRQGTEYPSVYIGTSSNVNLRISQHTVGAGSAWTKQHRPLRCVALHIEPLENARAYLAREDDVTKRWMRRYIELHGEDAWKSVKGGSYCAADAGKPRGL